MKDIKLKDKIAQGINDLFYIWKREFQTTFRDQGVLIFDRISGDFILSVGCISTACNLDVLIHIQRNRCVGKKHRFIIQQSAHVAIDAYLCLFYIWKREFQTTFRDQGVLIFFILVPLGYPLLYSFIYDNEVVREVPAVVVDDSHSSLSREYLRKVDATPDIKIVSYCADMEEAKQMLKNRRAYGIDL